VILTVFLQLPLEAQSHFWCLESFTWPNPFTFKANASIFNYHFCRNANMLTKSVASRTKLRNINQQTNSLDRDGKYPLCKFL
jgi:hypothetical protein